MSSTVGGSQYPQGIGAIPLPSSEPSGSLYAPGTAASVPSWIKSLQAEPGAPAPGSKAGGFDHPDDVSVEPSQLGSAPPSVAENQGAGGASSFKWPQPPPALIRRDNLEDWSDTSSVSSASSTSSVRKREKALRKKEEKALKEKEDKTSNKVSNLQKRKVVKRAAGGAILSTLLGILFPPLAPLMMISASLSIAAGVISLFTIGGFKYESSSPPGETKKEDKDREPPVAPSPPPAPPPPAPAPGDEPVIIGGWRKVGPGRWTEVTKKPPPVILTQGFSAYPNLSEGSNIPGALRGSASKGGAQPAQGPPAGPSITTPPEGSSKPPGSSFSTFGPGWGAPANSSGTGDKKTSGAVKGGSPQPAPSPRPPPTNPSLAADRLTPGTMGGNNSPLSPQPLPPPTPLSPHPPTDPPRRLVE